MRTWLAAVALVSLTFAVYQPAWHGGLLWDDDFHITRPALRSVEGLVRIWTEAGATLQYYPLLHSAFWLEHRLWGDAALGYHLVTIAMHATAALLFGLLLRRLRVPGAAIAAALFALHPVQVESVAWMTELKNTLSGVFYFGAALLYLRFDETRRATWYVAAAAVFVLAILTKTVTGTLPAALLVVFWWQRGALRWRHDVAPLAPLLALGAVFGAITGRWELVYNRCVGPDFEFTFLERLLIASRAAWFQLWKLAWPADLAFIYPRWHIDTGAWWQYVFLAAGAGTLCLLWTARRRTRAPLATVLLYCGTLFPTLGFFNLYTFRYSFVANHYQYLACAPVLALAAAGATVLARQAGVGRRPLAIAAVSLVAVLAVMTRLEARHYSDAITLYETTLERNPECWLAHNNLAGLQVDTAPDAALDHVEAALRLKPDLAEAHSVRGSVLRRKGRLSEALTEYQEAHRLNPSLYGASTGLGDVLLATGRVSDAVAEYREAVRAWPEAAELHARLGTALQRKGDSRGTIVEFLEALRLRPDSPDAPLLHNDVGSLLEAAGRPQDAEAQFRAALAIDPHFVDANVNLGSLLVSQGRYQEAVAAFQRALERRPDDAEAHNNLGVAWAKWGRPEEARAEFQRALNIDPGYEDARRNLGLALGTTR
jgi:protein O-mannosyl-transferase